MCGIISYFSNSNVYSKEITQVVSNALWIDSIRGDHSTGIIFESEGEPDYYKKAVAGWDFIQLDHVQSVLSDLKDTPYLIGHNRAATRGSVNSSNAHPFEHGDIIGVHNGTLYNHHSLTTSNHTVDSDALYKGISEVGSSIIIPKVNGAFNLLWHDSSSNTVHVLNNGDRPYCFAKIEGHDVLIGMSEELMLRWLVNKFGLKLQYIWSPKPYREYVFDVEGDMTKPVRKIDHVKYVAPIYVPPATTIVHKVGGNNVITPRTKIEFLADSYIVDMHLVNQKKVGTWHCETDIGSEVILFKVPEGVIVSDLWYEGMANWRNKRWVVDHTTVQLVPLYQGSDHYNLNDPIYCDTCNLEFEEEEVVTANGETLCLPCCTRYAIEDHEVDLQHRYKIN